MTDAYIEELVSILDRIKFHFKSGEVTDCYEAGMEKLVGYLAEAKKRERRVLFIGNGGNACIASHMTVDYYKNAGMKTIGLLEQSMITCIANDYGYDEIFSRQIKALGEKQDILIAISSSGNSPNIINGISMAKEIGMSTIAFTGFDYDNQTAKLADISIHVPCYIYGMVQSIHNMMLQQLVDMLCMRWI